MGARLGGGLGRRSSLSEDKLLLSFVNFGSEPTRGVGLFQTRFDERVLVGAGEWSEVFRARWLADGKVYAVKRSKRELKGKNDRRIQLAELDIMGRVGAHPHIVQYQQCWQESGHFYVQMELCAGTLAARSLGLTHAPSAAWLLDVLEQVAEALKQIHGLGILHCDVKPENVLVEAAEPNAASPGVLKLGDFGQALDVAARTDTRGGALLRGLDGAEGDCQYMAPELLSQHSEPTPAVDIFSLGLLLFELASQQQLPASGPVWQALRSGGAAAYLHGAIPQALEALVLAMLSSDPRDRPHAEQLLASVRAIRHAQGLARSYVRPAALDELASLPSGFYGRARRVTFDSRGGGVPNSARRPSLTGATMRRRLPPAAARHSHDTP